jgi:hypothetical protein
MKFLYFHCPGLMSFLKSGWQIIEILVLSGVHVLLMLFVCTCIYVHWCPTRFPYQMMFGRLTITRRASPVEQELLTPSKHSSALLFLQCQEKIEDTKRAVRSRKSTRNRQNIGQQKKGKGTNNYLQNTA